MKENNRRINGGLCIGFALLFILIGAVQFILGHNRGMTAQTIIAIATWVYAAVLLVTGIITEDRSRRSASADMFVTDEQGDYVETGFTDDFDTPEQEPVSLALAEERLRRYSATPSPSAAECGEFAATLDGIKQLAADSRKAMQAAERECSIAVDRAAEAYLNLDDKSTLLRKVNAKTDPNNENDLQLRQRAQRARDKAKRALDNANAQVEASKRKLEKAKKLVSRVSRVRRAYEKLVPVFTPSAQNDSL